MEKNYGLNWELELAQRKPEDWEYKLGGDVKCIAEIPPKEREKFLPKGELQNIGSEKMDCASRSPLNIIETKLNYLLTNHLLPDGHINWLIQNGYYSESGVELSDAYIAIKSGTTRSGNSLIAPLDAIHRWGVIPKKLLPQANTFEEHHDPKRITVAMEKLGKEFLKRISINYERVYEAQFGEFLERDVLDVGAYAWPTPVNGIYPRIEAQPNHAFMLFNPPKYMAFDNYIDSVDGDFIKRLAPDYDFLGAGYRVILGIAKPWSFIEWLKSIWPL